MRRLKWMERRKAGRKDGQMVRDEIGKKGDIKWIERKKNNLGRMKDRKGEILRERDNNSPSK